MSSRLFLLKELVRRDVKGRYAGSLFGLIWSFAQPLWMLALFGFVFSTVMKMPAEGVRNGSFAIFLFSGLLPWMAVQEGILRATTSVTDNSSLVKKLRFPAEILGLAVVLAALVHEGIATLVFFAVVAWTGEISWRGLPLLLLAIPLQIALTLGVGWLLAAIHVFFRDVAQILGMGLTAWFYLTPIVYPASYVPERLRPWVELNPLTGLVGLYRAALLADSPLPSPIALVSLGLSACGFFALGWWLFRRLKPSFVDEI
jgi:lipopolysaccharide transport system permease protein